MRSLTLHASLIDPPNPACAEKVERLKVRMQEEGWDGRRLLVRSDGARNQALTGANRLAAAEELDLEVPVLLIEDSDIDCEALAKLDQDSDAEDLLNALCAQGLTEVAEILEQESYLNTGSYLNFLRFWLRPSNLDVLRSGPRGRRNRHG